MTTNDLSPVYLPPRTEIAGAWEPHESLLQQSRPENHRIN